MVKGIDTAFDHIWNCVCLIKGRVTSETIGLFFKEITFITEYFLASSKWDFPVTNLLLATANFEP